MERVDISKGVVYVLFNAIYAHVVLFSVRFA
jgi:hypothetical protein